MIATTETVQGKSYRDEDTIILTSEDLIGTANRDGNQWECNLFIDYGKHRQRCHVAYSPGDAEDWISRNLTSNS